MILLETAILFEKAIFLPNINSGNIIFFFPKYYRDTMDFTEEQVKNLEDVFRQNLPPDKDSLTLTEFKKLMPSKNVGKYHKSV